MCGDSWIFQPFDFRMAPPSISSRIACSRRCRRSEPAVDVAPEPLDLLAALGYQRVKGKVARHFPSEASR